jgi:hypothetical protein
MGQVSLERMHQKNAETYGCNNHNSELKHGAILTISLGTNQQNVSRALIPPVRTSSPPLQPGGFFFCCCRAR